MVKVEPFPEIQENVKILALVARRYSGKSEVCSRILTQDPRFVRASFGDVLKWEYASLNDLPAPAFWTPEMKEDHRPGLISLSWQMKKSDPYFFAKRLFASVTSGQFIVIDDLRFIEELQLVMQWKGIVYSVYSDPWQRKRRGWFYQRGIDDETSETELTFLSGYDWLKLTGGGVIYNTKDDEPQYVDRQIELLLAKHFPKAPGVEDERVAGLRKRLRNLKSGSA